jgi:hypothetical protein
MTSEGPLPPPPALAPEPYIVCANGLTLYTNSKIN